FEYENINGGKTSLESLKGKFVYIDVWATWCGPCIGEIPALKAVEKEYHGKNIEFVSISIDDKKDVEKWKKMVADKELKGIQLFADNDWKSDFVKNYAIDGIPRFILIDTEGKIVNADAPRPSDAKLKDLLKEVGL
ncbi:TlpA disulfide reductase family protein, partial [Flavobacterium filum]